MKNRLAIASIVVSLLAGCAGTDARVEGDMPAAPAPAKPAAAKRGALIVLPARFADHLSIDRVKQECDMLRTFNGAVLRYGNAYAMKVHKRQRLSDAGPGQSVLLVSYEAVDANVMNALTLRPGSEATVKASIIKDGEVLSTMSKHLVSRVSFGACGRLDKIATAGAKVVAKWASRQPY
ncbi:hypothetical protein [Denitromonas halophila]|uniref:DUF4410 domain-containing protein n=1 Tax=Denitromonas halophila TaxID=1629404 RepID=A0A557R1L3_9RHOO|nr:hypothetical protein [Denitromonas halophila]TVO59034.1 hypothetical protein FHP91_05120 [Denitromonas halophila]